MVFFGYILLACKNPRRAAPGPHSSNQSIVASIIPRELDCSAAPRSCKLPAKLLRLVGMAVGIQAVKDGAETQVCELEIRYRSRHWCFRCFIILDGILKKVKSDCECMAHQANCPQGLSCHKSFFEISNRLHFEPTVIPTCFLCSNSKGCP